MKKKVFTDKTKCAEYIGSRFDGKKAIGLRCFGDAVFLRKEYIEAAVYNRLEKLSDKQRDHWSKFENIPDDFEFVRHTVTETPLYIDLDDGQSLGIFFSSEGEVGIIEGEVPDEKVETNFLPEKFFRQSLNRTVSGIRVDAEDGRIESVTVVFESGHAFRFGSVLNMCSATLFGRNTKILPITFSELKNCLTAK